MFCWPCISIHPCDENQLDALFVLSLFRQSTSTCFGHICSPSSGGILYILQLVRVVILVDCLLANRQSTKKHNTYNLLYIYIHTHSISPDDGLQIWPKHAEVNWRNKLRINSASSWFPLHGCIEMHGQQKNIKLCLTSYFNYDRTFFNWQAQYSLQLWTVP